MEKYILEMVGGMIGTPSKDVFEWNMVEHMTREEFMGAF